MVNSAAAAAVASTGGAVRLPATPVAAGDNGKARKSRRIMPSAAAAAETKADAKAEANDENDDPDDEPDDGQSCSCSCSCSRVVFHSGCVWCCCVLCVQSLSRWQRAQSACGGA